MHPVHVTLQGHVTYRLTRGIKRSSFICARCRGSRGVQILTDSAVAAVHNVHIRHVSSDSPMTGKPAISFIISRPVTSLGPVRCTIFCPALSRVAAVSHLPDSGNLRYRFLPPNTSGSGDLKKLCWARYTGDKVTQ